MKRVTLDGTNLTVSRFVFGTGSLHRVGNTEARTSLLSQAVDAGFTHFDTAPYYGFGSSERALCDILRQHPTVTVTTKVGLFAPGGEDQRDVVVYLRKVLGRLIPHLSKPIIDFSLKRAQQCFDDSRRRLGRECIDLYLLHEPVLRLIHADEWQGWLARCQQAGTIRYVGVAGTQDRIREMLRGASGLCQVIQTADSVAGREADGLNEFGRTAQLTYGYLSSARRHQPAFDARVVLQQSLVRNPRGAILVSTSQPTRLRAMATLV